MAPHESIEKAIQDLEAEREKITQAISDLRGTLAKLRGKGVVPGRKTAPGVFQRKYELNARDLIVQVLRGSRKSLHVGQIKDNLEGQGYEFLKQTISLNLKHLEKAGRVRREKAPRGSGYTHAYVLVPERPSAVEGERASA